MKLSNYVCDSSGTVIVKLTGNCQVAMGNNATSQSVDWIWVLNTNGKFLYHSSSTSTYSQADYTRGYEHIIEYTPTSLKLTIDGSTVFNQSNLVNTSSLPHTLRLYDLSAIQYVESITVL